MFFTLKIIKLFNSNTISHLSSVNKSLNTQVFLVTIMPIEKTRVYHLILQPKAFQYY